MATVVAPVERNCVGAALPLDVLAAEEDEEEEEEEEKEGGRRVVTEVT